MAFVVQTDSGDASGANAYLSVAAFKAYHQDRGQSWGTAADPAIEAAIVRATDYLDRRFTFVGRRSKGREQTTEWPRICAWDREGRLFEPLPRELLEACAEYALRALTAALDPDPVRGASGAVIQSESKSVGPISKSVTYAAGGIPMLPKYPAADQRLIRAGLVESGGMLARG